MNYKINRVVIIGAGTMGAGIAAHLAGTGIQVRLLDIVPNKLSDSEIKKGLTLRDRIVRNRLAQNGKNFAVNQKTKLKLIYEKSMGDLIEIGNLEDDLGTINDCDWIIEVAVERLDIKKELMKKIAAYRKKGSIISTNTSGISVNKIVEGQNEEFKQHFLGTHFFNPVRYMKLLELIPCKETSKEIMEFMTDFGEKRLGKGIVIAKDTPNFIANRVGVFSSVNILNKMVEYGLNVAEVDELTGGVFKTFDMVGLDVLNHTIDSMLASTDDENELKKWKKPAFFQKLISENKLGNKTECGMFKRIKTEKGRVILMLDYNTNEYVPITKRTFQSLVDAEKATSGKEKMEKLLFGDDLGSKFNWQLMKDRLLYTAECAPVIADSYMQIDNAVEWGFNAKLGPFKEWDAIGFEKVVKRMTDEGEKIPENIKKRISDGKKYFYDYKTLNDKPYIVLNSGKYDVIKDNGHAVLRDIGDGVACFEFKTKGNSITDGAVELLNSAIDEVEKNYKGLVIGSNSKNFSVGANLSGDGKIDANTMVKNLQDTVMKIKYSKSPVVTAVTGRALGGGAEIVLHSYSSVAYVESYIGLVEIGVGLIPAGGGTKEAALRAYGDSKSKTVAELANSLKDPFEKILMAKTSTSAFEALKMGYLGGLDKIIINNEYLLDEAKNKVLSLSSEGFRPNVLIKEIKVPGRDGMALLNMIIFNMKCNKYLSEYDAYLAEKLAYILSGGNVVGGTYLTEQHFLDLEREVFVSLLKEEKTLARINHMLTKKKPLRN